MLSDYQHMLWATVSIFSNGHWRPFDRARNWGSKGLKLRKVAARVRFYLQIRKSLLTGRAAQKWKVQAATVESVSGLWRKPCKQRRLQLPELGTIRGD